MSFGVVYCIENIVNNKKYIGQTIQPLETRWKEHWTHTKHYDFPLYRAMRKYGIKNFTIRIIDEADSENELNSKETYWIHNMNTLCPHGYNALDGQPGNSKIICKETRDKLAQVLVERWKNPEYREKMIAATTGKRRKPFTEEQIKKLSESHKGKTLSESQKQKIGEQSKRLWCDPQYKEKAILGLKKAIKSQERPVINVDTGRIYCSATQAAKELGLYQQNITKCCQGKRKRTGGFRWEYWEVMKDAV